MGGVLEVVGGGIAGGLAGGAVGGAVGGAAGFAADLADYGDGACIFRGAGWGAWAGFGVGMVKLTDHVIDIHKEMNNIRNTTEQEL